MPPGLLHAVYTSESCVAEGCHFFTTGTLLKTLVSLIHTFICNDFITNTTHPETRVLLRRIQHFLHRGLVLEVDLKPAEEVHLLNLNVKAGDTVDSKSVFNFLAICTLSFFAEALDPRLYVAPGQSLTSTPSITAKRVLNELFQSSIKFQKCQEICIARDCARECLEWFNDKFEVHQDGQEVPIDLLLLFLRHVALATLHYKRVAEKNGFAADGNAMFKSLKSQIKESIFLMQPLWTSWLYHIASPGAFSNGLEFCTRGSEQKGDWLQEALVPNPLVFTIIRKEVGPLKLEKTINELKEYGTWGSDEFYFKARDANKTISFVRHR